MNVRLVVRQVIAASIVALWATAATAASTSAPTHVELLIRNVVIYDGSGGEPFKGDIAISRRRVVAIGAQLQKTTADRTVDAHGLAAAPGFINVLSHAGDTLIYDGRGMSDIKQGITLELMGEGESYGPLTDAMRAESVQLQSDIHYDITWSTLGEFLDFLAKKGTSINIASFVGAATVRAHEIGLVDRAPTAAELARMQDLVRAAMREGALGVSSALVYSPGVYAKSDELIALARAAGEYGGGYISHIRNEADQLLEAIDEMIHITREAQVHGEVHHLKAAGQRNWPKMRQAIEKIEAARATGLPLTANMYSYNASSTGLNATMPPWVQEGGLDAWIERLKQPEIRKRVIAEMRIPNTQWDNSFANVSSPAGIVFVSFKTEKLKPLTGKTLAEVAKLRGTAPEDTLIDLVIEDHNDIGAAYFDMAEDNIRLGLSQPWVSLETDGGAMAPEGVFLTRSDHPRSYGSLTRFLGRYVREQKVTTLPDAIRRLTRLPAQNWKLRDRGCLDQGCHADIVIFDPATITDHATFAQPALFSSGIVHVFVNGSQVLKDGQHTGAKPGEVVHGPGWKQGARPAVTPSS
jgi:N-acyl-D-amino-acid deacylase